MDAPQIILTAATTLILIAGLWFIGGVIAEWFDNLE